MKIRKMTAAFGVAAALLAGTLTTAASAPIAYAQSPTDATADIASQHVTATVVLVHGAFEDATAWSDVTRQLQTSGYHVIAPAVPLRGIGSDVDYLDSVLHTVQGPVVLVGHSYGGVLVSALAARNPQVAALVYVAAFIPEAGETVAGLDAQFPGSLLGPETTYTVNYPGGTDMYVKPDAYGRMLAGDRTPSDAAVAAAQQRPLDTSTLTEPITQAAPADIPKFAIVATQDQVVPAAAEQFEAERAGARIYPVYSAHDVPVSHPQTVVSVITDAASGARSTHGSSRADAQ
jgi:pimeloyl-ACP methyl ester carboxylesterase